MRVFPRGFWRVSARGIQLLAGDLAAATGRSGETAGPTLLAVAQFHGPSDGEQSQDEIAEALGAVLDSFAVRFLGDDSQDDGCEEGEQ